MVFTNLLIGLPAMLVCLVLQIAVAFWSVRYYIRHVHSASASEEIFPGVRLLLAVMLVMVLGNFAQIVLWGVVFVWLEEFADIYEAVYHSAVNFTSLGYGDVVMSRQWKLLGPLEALNGILMLSVTGAALMAMLQQMIKVQLQARASRPNA
jgi:ion channel